MVVEVEEEAGDNWRDTGEPGTRQKCRRCRKSFSHSKTDNCRFWGVQRTRRQSIVCRASGRSNWASTSLASNWRSRELQYREQTMGPQIVGPRPSDLVKIPAYVTAQAGRREVFLGTFLEYIPLLRFLCDIFQHFITLPHSRHLLGNRVPIESLINNTNSLTRGMSHSTCRATIQSKV